MGAEIGATVQLFPYDHNMAMYLKATGREAIADAADKVADDLRPDDGALYDQVIEIDLDQLKPLINGPHSPDRAHRVGAERRRGGRARTAGRSRSRRRSSARCTNSLVRGHHPRRVDRPPGVGEGADGRRPSCWSRPGSEQIRATIERDGLLADLEAIGATVLANACGPCIGQWDAARRASPATPNTIVNSYNRNFPKRNDGSANTLSFVTSPGHGDRARARPAGSTSTRPTDTLTAPDGTEVTLEAPVGEVLPDRGYDPGENTFTAPPADGSGVDVEVVADERPPAAARSRSRRGTATTTSACRC